MHVAETQAGWLTQGEEWKGHQAEACPPTVSCLHSSDPTRSREEICIFHYNFRVVHGPAC